MYIIFFKKSIKVISFLYWNWVSFFIKIPIMNVSLGREFFSLVFRWNFLICLVFWLFLKKNDPKKVHRFDKTTHTQFGTETCLAWKPSLKIGSVNKAFLFWYWQRLKTFFFRNKTFVFQESIPKLLESVWKRISWNLIKFQLNQTTDRKKWK